MCVRVFIINMEFKDGPYRQEYKPSVSSTCSIGITSCNTRSGSMGVFVKDKNDSSNNNIYFFNNPDRKCYINSKYFTILDAIFKNISFEPIKISDTTKDVSLIVVSELVFKVEHMTGLTKGCIVDSLTSITICDGKFHIYRQQA